MAADTTQQKLFSFNRRYVRRYEVEERSKAKEFKTQSASLKYFNSNRVKDREDNGSFERRVRWCD